MKAVAPVKHAKRGSRNNSISVIRRIIRNSSRLATHPVPTAGPRTQPGCHIHFTPRAARLAALPLPASCLLSSERLCIDYRLFPKVPWLPSFLVISWNRTWAAETPGSPRTTLAAPDNRSTRTKLGVFLSSAVVPGLTYFLEELQFHSLFPPPRRRQDPASPSTLKPS